jgi:hypothetical protein
MNHVVMRHVLEYLTTQSCDRQVQVNLHLHLARTHTRIYVSEILRSDACNGRKSTLLEAARMKILQAVLSKGSRMQCSKSPNPANCESLTKSRSPKRWSIRGSSIAHLQCRIDKRTAVLKTGRITNSTIVHGSNAPLPLRRGFLKPAP